MMDFRPMSHENDSTEDRRLNQISLMSLVLLISGCFLTLTLIGVVIDQVLGTEYLVFQLEFAAVYGLEVTGSSELTATWNITLLATNPNRKLVVDFDDELCITVQRKTSSMPMTRRVAFWERSSCRLLSSYSRATRLVSTSISEFQRYRTEVWGKGSPGILDLYCDEGEFLFSPKTNDTGILTH
ncbi:hypothetical protein ACLB2K_063744 [Fragaria x ananassa]